MVYSNWYCSYKHIVNKIVRGHAWSMYIVAALCSWGEVDNDLADHPKMTMYKWYEKEQIAGEGAAAKWQIFDSQVEA